LRRKKLIHTQGVTCKVNYVPVAGQPYTGSFSGSNYAFLRFSTATAFNSEPYSLIPGVAIKFLRTGVKSGNFMAMYSLEGQQGFNIFENELTNHVPELSSKARVQLRTLEKNFRRVSKWPSMVGLSDIATYGSDGKKVSNPVFPYQIYLRPNPALTKAFPSAYDKNRSYIDHVASINPSVHKTLYDVYASSAPGAAKVKVASIQLAGSCMKSRFADESLFFQHQRMEDDLALRKNWVPTKTPPIPRAAAPKKAGPLTRAKQAVKNGVNRAKNAAKNGARRVKNVVKKVLQDAQ